MMIEWRHAIWPASTCAIDPRLIRRFALDEMDLWMKWPVFQLDAFIRNETGSEPLSIARHHTNSFIDCVRFACFVEIDLRQAAYTYAILRP